MSVEDGHDAETHKTSLAGQRTILAAERTILAALRTGLAVAGGGSLVITLLGDHWPSWLQTLLVALFLVLGYGLVQASLRRYSAVTDALERAGEHQLEVVSARTVTIAMWMVQGMLTIVVVLFLVGAFEA